MPTPVNRQSLKTDIESRYATQHAGGAFDAKKPTPDVFGLQEKFWTKPGFVKDEELGLGGSKQYNQSLYLQGFSDVKYKR